MISIDEFSAVLDELASELPQEFYEGLNLGINLSAEAKLHPKSRGDGLYIMGEYFHNAMGRGIVIYYGSFRRVHSRETRDELLGHMRETLRHEFRHHMEGRAWEDGLKREDARRLREYLGDSD
ncbi:MAG: metallopeptidase family protein [Oscillospiraceae bacterium]|nr:metallopeptidase family protein [Oscillospiraceae bacterium]